jgi:hypothetical protein
MSIYDKIWMVRENMEKIQIIATVTGVVVATSVWCMTSL